MFFFGVLVQDIDDKTNRPATNDNKTTENKVVFFIII